MRGPHSSSGLFRWVSTHAPSLAGLAAILVLYAAAGIRYSNQHFLTWPVFFNLLDAQAVLGIVAVGLTFVIIAGGIDLSVGAVMGLSSVLIAKLIMGAGWPAWAAIATAIAGGAVFGALQGAIIQATGLGAFIVTLAGMFLARGVGFLVSLEPVGITDAGHAGLSGLHRSFGEHGSLRIGAMIMLAAVLLGAYAARYTRLGRGVYALGGSEEASILMGLPVPRIRVGVYITSGMCAALAGAALTFQLSSGSHIEGIGMELDAIAAVVIGGALLSGGSGSVLGSFVGTLIIGLVLTIVTTYEGGLNSGMTRVLIAGLLLAFVLLQRLLSRLAGAGLPRGALL